jgi:transaldolase
MAKRESPILAVLTDVDGTLVTKEKVLTPRALEAVRKLHERGVVFTITSGRPPFGMRMLVEALGLTMPMAAFNGGVIVLPDLSILDERVLPEYLVPAVIDMILAHGLDVWVFRSNDWFVRSTTAPRVARETSNIRQAPLLVTSFDAVLTGAVKVVGVSEDHPRVAACEAAVQEAFGDRLSAARSQPHYLDVTHPAANKGVVIERLSRYLKIPMECIATLGDQPNDVLMFERSGLSIAMGNASDEVKARATFTTTSFADEGFANAVERFILPRAEPATGPAVKPTGRLHRLGQSVWLDGISRDDLRAGTLESAIRDLSVTGVTWSPSAFGRAMADSPAYDASIAEHARRGMSPEEVLYELVFQDLGRAADLLAPIHERTAGVDGWVTLPVSPLLARDARAALAAARALFARAGRPNVMIDVPGTNEGLVAVEEAIFEGIPVNVTMLLSREHYLGAAEAFLRGIERRIEAGLEPDVSSLASVATSPWHDAVAGADSDDLGAQLAAGMAQRTYGAYRALLSCQRWQRVYNAGARPQRLVWANLSAGDDPPPSSVMRAEALAAQLTVIAMTARTLHDFAERGEITGLMRADGGAGDAKLTQLGGAGIDLYALATRLRAAALGSTISSWNALTTVIAATAAGGPPSARGAGGRRDTALPGG